MAKEIEVIKKGYSRDRFGLDQIEELKRCMTDPLYFCKQYVKIQHPTKGRVPFKTWPFQDKIIKSFHDNRYCIALTSRQMGKCLESSTQITKNGQKINIGSLIKHNFKERLVGCLENLLVKLVLAR